MNLIQADKDSLTIKMSKKEFSDIMSAFSAIRQDYTSVDPSIVEMSKDRVSEMLDALTHTMQEISTVSQSRPVFARAAIS